MKNLFDLPNGAAACVKQGLALRPRAARWKLSLYVFSRLRESRRPTNPEELLGAASRPTVHESFVRLLGMAELRAGAGRQKIG